LPIQIKFTVMNYEELLGSREEKNPQMVALPIGSFYREAVDGKLALVVAIRRSLLDNIAFCEALKKECEQNTGLTHPHQLHFVPRMQNGDITSLVIERGSFQTLSQFLFDDPGVVAQKKFVLTLVRDLLDTAEYLHKQGVFHVCYSPTNVFVRKGTGSAMLLSHGSYYLGMQDQAAFYRSNERYVAPEVLAHGTIDERCDIYSIGRLMEFLYADAEMPVELKRVVKKAVSESPEDRYQTAADMRRAIDLMEQTRSSVMKFAAVLVVALISVGLYFELVPQPLDIEFIKSVPRQGVDDLLDDGFDPATELGLIRADTIGQLTPEQQEQQKVYEAKCESIFRKRYTKEADRILSKIYNNSYMGANEKKFVAGSSSTIQELMKAQMDIAGETHLSDTRSQRLATEIIDQVTEQKKAALQQHGIQK